MEAVPLPPERLPETDAFDFCWMYDDDIECFWTSDNNKEEDVTEN